MKPTTKIQKIVAPLAEKLPEVTDVQKKWAYKLLKCYATVSRNRMFCLECSHKWDPGSEIIKAAAYPKKNGPDLTIKCPECKKKLIVYRYDHPKFNTTSLWGVWTTFKDYQVLRVLYVHKNMAKNKKPWWHAGEDMQYWIGKDGSITLFSRTSNSYYGGSSGFCGDITLRPNGTEEYQKYNIDLNDEVIYPKKQLLSEITRNGFIGEYYDLSAHQMFAFLMNDVYGETLLKTGHVELFKYFAKNRRLMTKNLWKALRICIRHKYELKGKSISDWVDYIKLLIYFKKDIHNPVYVCPKDLHREHNKLVQKKMRIDTKKELLKKAADIQNEEEAYSKKCMKFFNLSFSGENGLTITPMKSVKQVFEESTLLKHCAFTSNYHKKENTLLLSASIEGVVLETIEINTNRMEIIQSRGLQNSASKYNIEIVALVNRNLEQIKKIANNNRPRSAKKQAA